MTDKPKREIDHITQAAVFLVFCLIALASFFLWRAVL
jgi:hypothetical protein